MVCLLLFRLFDWFGKSVNLALADRFLLRRFDHVIYLLCIGLTVTHLHFFVVLPLFRSAASTTSPTAILGFGFLNFRTVGLIFDMLSDARSKARPRLMLLNFNLYVHLVDRWNPIILIRGPLKFQFCYFHFLSILHLRYYFSNKFIVFLSLKNLILNIYLYSISV